MRILHVTDAAAAGVLSAVTGLARAQAADEAFERVAFCYTPRADSPPHTQIATALGEGVRVERWSRSPRGALLGLSRGLHRELRHGRYDIVHLHSTRAGFLGRMIAAVTGASTHRVYSPHGFAFGRADFPVLLRELSLLLERLAVIGGRDLVLVSDTERELADSRLPGTRNRVLPNCVDTRALAPRVFVSWAERGIASAHPVDVVHIGRISHQKRPDLFARIAETMQARFPGGFTFTWIGDGNRDLLRPAGHVEVTGWLSAAEVRHRLSKASLVLFTSAGEGMPVSLLEAQSLAVPVIGSDVVGVRDVIAAGVDGYLFSTAAEAQAALIDLRCPDTSRSFGAAARERIVSEHSLEGLSDRSRTIYQECLGTVLSKAGHHERR